MSLIGPFYNAVNDEENIYDITGFYSPGSISLGVIPPDYIFEELKAIVTSPAPAGTTVKVTDQFNNVLIPPGKISIERAVASTVNVNRRINTITHLSAVAEGPAASVPVEMVLIKKIWRIP